MHIVNLYIKNDIIIIINSFYKIRLYKNLLMRVIKIFTFNTWYMLADSLTILRQHTWQHALTLTGFLFNWPKQHSSLITKSETTY